MDDKVENKNINVDELIKRNKSKPKKCGECHYFETWGHGKSYCNYCGKTTYSSNTKCFDGCLDK